MDIVTLALAKKYVKESLAGAGALKGDKGDAFTYADFTKDQLAALKGEKGDAFTFEDFSKEELESLKGEKGDAFTFEDFTADQLANLKGEKGDAFTYTDFTEEQLASLKGEKGDAFTFEDFSAEELESLKGPKGDAFTYADFTPEQLENLKGNKGDAFTFEDFTPAQLAALKGAKGDAYVITESDYAAIGKKVAVPNKVSELTNDSGYITSDEAEVYSNKIEDVKLNGESIVIDKIANITIPDIQSSIGKTFTTNVTIGNLAAGTPISEEDTIADILYKILYKENASNMINLYFGSSDNIPSKIEDLDWKVQRLNIDVDTLVATPIIQNIKSGNVQTEDGQYPTLITTKTAKLVKLKKWNVVGGESLDLTYKTIETDKNYIYYIDTLNYNEDEGGIDYVFTF